MAEIPDWLKDFELEHLLDEILEETSQRTQIDYQLQQMFLRFRPEECGEICSLVNMLSKKLGIPEIHLMHAVAGCCLGHAGRQQP